MRGKEILAKGILANEAMLWAIDSAGSCYPDRAWSASEMAVEMVASYGMAVGREVFETCVWIGRFVERWRIHHGGLPHALVYRREVKAHLCHDSRAKDANIRQAILDLYPRTGGGKIPQIGTKGQPGPLYGVSKDIWAAVGVGLTHQRISRCE